MKSALCASTTCIKDDKATTTHTYIHTHRHTRTYIYIPTHAHVHKMTTFQSVHCQIKITLCCITAHIRGVHGQAWTHLR